MPQTFWYDAKNQFMKHEVIKKAKLTYKPATVSPCWKSAVAFSHLKKNETEVDVIF